MRQPMQHQHHESTAAPTTPRRMTWCATSDATHAAGSPAAVEIRSFAALDRFLERRMVRAGADAATGSRTGGAR